MTDPEFLNRTESIRTAVPDMDNSINSSRFNPQIYDTGQRAKLHPAGKTPPGSRHYTAASRFPIALTFNILLSVIRARISNVPGTIPCPHACRYAAVKRAVRFLGNPPYRPSFLSSLQALRAVYSRLRVLARGRKRNAGTGPTASRFPLSGAAVRHRIKQRVRVVKGGYALVIPDHLATKLHALPIPLFNGQKD